LSTMALDNKIESIQRSTKTLMPWMVPVHDRLRMKYGWYYHWSMLKYSSLMHFVALFVFVLGLSTGAMAYYGFLPTQVKAAAVTCYWVGGDGNWNDATHWSDTSGGTGSQCDGGVVPGSDDVATIDASSGTPTITVNAAVDVAGFAMSAGTINQGANTFAVGVSDFVLSGGTFTGGSSNMTITGDFTISSGAFTTTSATMYMSPSVATEGDWIHTAGGTFTASTGTVEFTGVAATIDVTTTESFNNLTLNKNSFAALTSATGDTLTVTGTFNATNGSWSYTGSVATVNAQGSATLGSGFDGGNAAITFTGAAASTINVQGGSFPATTMNAANATMNGPSSGTASFGGSFTMAAGTFTGGAGGMTTSYGFTISGGAFTAPTGTLTIGSNSSFTHTAGGTFDDNSGTVVFSGDGSPTINVIDTETFNILTFNKTAGSTATITAGDTLIAESTLTLTESSIGTGTLQAQGAVSIASTFDGGSAALQLTGGNTQTFTQTAGGVMPTGTFTINKTAGTVVNLGAALTLATAGQDLTLTQGILDLKGYGVTLTAASDVLTVSANGTLRMQGNETVTASTKTVSTGATITYTGDGQSDVDTYTITTNFATNYYHLTINSTDTGDIFQLGAAASLDGTLTVSQGILSLNGQNLTDTAVGDAAARGNIAGAVRLQGGETIFWSTNDTDSGTYEYVGDGAGGTTSFSVKDFGVGADYYNLTVNSTAGDETFNLVSALDANYNLTITSGTLDVVNLSDYQINVAKNWSSSGGFEARSGEVILDGSAQTVSGTTTFNDFTKQVGTAEILTFTAASTQTINGILTLNGATGELLSLRSSVDTNYWNIVNTGDTEAVSFVDVMDSNNTGSTITATDSTNSDHNVGWSFGPVALTVSGTGLDANGAALTGSSYNVALRVDGAALQTTATSVIDGTFSFSVEGLVAGNVITIYFYGATDPEAGTYVGNAVTLTDASTNITGVNLQADNVLLRADNGANSLTIADMAFYDSSDNANNLLFTAIAAIPDTLTVGDGVKVTVNSGDTFTPGGDSVIGTGGLTISGAWTATGTESLSLGGALTATAGTFTAASDTVTFTGGTATVDINATMTFNNLTLNKTDGAVLTITGGDTLAIGGTLTLTDGYVNTGTLALNTANLTGSSTFDGGSAPILLDDSQTVTLSDGWVLPSLNVDTATVTIANSASITFANAGLTVAATGTLNQGTGTTVSFTGSGDRTIDVNASDTLVNLTINKAADGNIITIAAGDTLILTGTLTLTNGQVNTGTLQAQGDVSLASTFDGGDAVLQFTGAGTQTMTDSGGVLPSGTVTINKTVGTVVSLAAALTLDTAGQDLTITSGTLNLAGFGLTLTAAADVLTVSASGTLRLQGGETITASTKTLDASSTVEYTGSSGPYTLQTLSYSNLTIAGGPAVVFSLPANTTGLTTLTITSGILAAAGFNLTATTLVNDATLRLQGNETTVTFTTMDTTSGAVEYVGRDVAETLTVKDFGATDYYDLTINDANTNKATFQLGAAKVLGRNLALTSGTLDLASFGLTVPTDFTIGASGTLKLQGGETVSAIDTNSGTVNYNGAGSYTTALAAGNTYTNLTFSGSGVWEPSGAVAVSGALTVSSGIFDLDGQNLAVTGVFSNDGTLRLAGGESSVSFGTMDTNSGTVTYDGGGSYASLAAGNSYYHLTFNGAGDWTLASELTVAGNLTITSGTLAAGAQTINLAGTWSNSDVFTAGTSTVNMNGTNQSIIGNTTFRNLTKQVTSTATLTFTAASTQTVDGTLTLTGVSGGVLSLRSSVTDTDWNLVLNGSATVNYLNIKDSNLTINQIYAAHSTSSGNNSALWLFPDHYTLTTASSSVSTGSAFTLTVTMKEAGTETTVVYNGDVNFTFTGANTSAQGYVPTATDKNSQTKQFGQSTTLTLTNGVATTSIVLYKAEALALSASSSSPDLTSNSLSLTSSSQLTGLSLSITPSHSTVQAGATYTNNNPVSLTLAATNAARVRIGTSSDALSSASFGTYAASQTLALASTASAQSAFAQFQDEYGNNSGTVTSSNQVVLDTSGPEVKNAYLYDVSYPANNTYAVLVSFKLATDGQSGVSNSDQRSSYTVKRNNESAVTLSENNSYISDISNSKTFYVLDSSLQPNIGYSYTISISDNLGNASITGATIAPSINNLKEGKDVTSNVIKLSTSSNAQTLQKELGKLELSKAKAEADVSSANKDEVTATVSWLSSIPSTSQVFYGPGKDLSFQSQLDKGLNTSHSVVLTGLKPDTTYAYKVVSSDTNGNTAEIGGQSFTTKAVEGKDSILKIITKKLTAILADIWQAIKTFFTFDRAQAATPSGGVIYVIDISSQAAPAHFISWPKGMGSVSLQQCSPGCSAITTTGANFFVATNVKTGTGYSYKVGSLATNIDTAPTKTPEITKIDAKPLTSGAIITWRTDNEPSTSLVSYGASQATDQQSPTDPYFNQSHTVYLKNLKPATTYYYKVTSANKNSTATASQLQSFTTAKAEKQASILEQIIQALTKVFRMFEGWINK